MLGITVQVREVTQEMIAEDYDFTQETTMRWQSHAILALQEAAEHYLVHLFEDAYVGCLPT